MTSRAISANELVRLDHLVAELRQENGSLRAQLGEAMVKLQAAERQVARLRERIR